MKLHSAFCMWHASVKPEMAEAEWNIPKHRHIYRTIRSSDVNVLHADDALGSYGFEALRTISRRGTCDYYARQIWLERVS